MEQGDKKELELPFEISLTTKEPTINIELQESTLGIIEGENIQYSSLKNGKNSIMEKI